MKQIHNKHIVKSLPLLASILGDRYGVEILIGGDEAKTDGKTIFLPSLPLECDDTFLNLLRGYIDHEAAHVRFTDFALLQAAQLTPFEHYVWNCIEDWRIEQKIASHFNGCKINLLWLIEHVFYCTKKQAKKALDKAISEWLLLSMRAWDLEKLRPQVLALEKIIDKQCPQLLPELRVLLLNVQKQCENTEEAIEHARNIVNCIEKYIKQQEQITNAKGKPKEQLSQENHKNQGGNSENKMLGDTQMTLGEQTSAVEINELVKALQDLLAADEKQLPKNIGEISKKIIEKQKPAKDMFKLQVAKAGVKTIDNLEDFAMQKALRISTSLKARLQGLLQAQDLKRYLPASRGRINAHRLHGLSVQDSRVFLKHTKRESTNTAVHILFDTSGSMSNNIEMASQACFALASALGNTKGINVAVSTFPAHTTSMKFAGIFPLLRHGQKVSTQFKIRAWGSTPLTESLWWVYQTLLQQPEPRKIILLLTDGEPDYRESALHAINYAEKIGLEIYGIGIPPCQINNILPEHKSIKLESMNQLPQAMFGLLQHALLNNK